MKDRLTTAPLPLERPQCSCGTWNARSAIGTGFSLWNSPWPMERALAHLERPLANGTPAGLFCIVRWQDGINPYIISVLIRSALRRSAPWNAQSAIGTASGLLERPQGVSKKPLLHTRYTRNRGGNVEQSWCFRGERFSFRGPRKSRIFGESRGLGRPLIKWSGISHCDPSAECECKGTAFF